jgi:hypothetical protein
MTEHCSSLPKPVTVAFVVFAALLIIIASDQGKQRKKDIRADFKKCVGEQIEVARQNWDTVLPSTRDDAEFVAQDQLRDFITEVCYDSGK